MNKRIPSLLAVLLVGVIYLEGGMDFVEHSLMDLRFRLLGQEPTGKVVVVAADARSLESLKVWPWPRGYHATVLNHLVEAGATEVAFDLDLSSPSAVKEDDALETALKAAKGRTILAVASRWQQAPGGGKSGGGWVETQPLERFSAHAILAGTSQRPEGDGLIRRHNLETLFQGPSMVDALMGKSSPDGSFYIDFGINAASITEISYLDVLTGKFDAAKVRGRKVIVGTNAVRLGEQAAVPVQGSLSGTILEALAFESVASGRALRRLPPALGLMGALLLSLLLGPHLDTASWRRGLLVVCGCSAGLFGLSMVVQATAPVLLDISPMVLSLVAIYAFALVRHIDRQHLGLLSQTAEARKAGIMMRHVVQNSSDAIITVDTLGRIEAFNPAAQSLFHFLAAAVRGRPISDLVAGGLSAAEASDGSGRLLSTPVEGVGYRRDGSTFHLEMSVTSSSLDGQRIRVAFMRDITERKKQEAALEHQATHDVLTQLPNRILLQERAESMLRQAKEEDGNAVVLVLDLDRFKEVNDTLGHKMGDLLLQRIARRLEEPLRADDTIARIGGDEFAVLLPQAGIEPAQAMARLLVAALAKPFELQGLALRVDVSIGIALYPDHGQDAVSLLQHGDVAMYTAKRSRTPVALYDLEQDLSSVRHLTLRGELKEAVDKDHLVLHFQPKIFAASNRAFGVEALVRWNHPEHGMLFPDDFIPLAENTGLIKPITRWVLRAAVAQCAEWQRQGLPMNLSVNCSARNLMEDDLPQAIDAILREYGVPPDRLTLEITETSLIEDPERALQVATYLHSQGLCISIDDFGTGYSSLNYLRRLPVQELKIDKSFVMKMDENESDEKLVLSIIDLAHNMGLRSVAEGVETEAVWERLRAMGCDVGQGYYFSRPLPAEALSEWLRTSAWSLKKRAVGGASAAAVRP
ncbi:MAG: EAL domain-containing protein [Acidobacteria bacterium]|nr:MAG: EAL domain-containing protein [Acidobacteriota bacterium]